MSKPREVREREPQRLEAFSDGVMAVIITIMAFSIPTPDGSTPGALRGLAGFAFELLVLEVGDECVNNGLQAAFHDEVELVEGKADAVVCEAVLGEVVGANLFGAVAGAYLLLAGAGQLGVLAIHLDFVEARAENAHALFAILDLRLFVLATDNGTGGDVGDAHG